MNFYNVPEAPGVPTMLRDPSLAVALPYVPAGSLLVNFSTAGLTASIGGLFGDTYSGDTGAAQWGVFDDSGASVIDFDTFLGIEYRNSTRISDYPLEQGSFENYNKVNNPFDVVIGLACGGDFISRANFLEQCAAAAASLDLYTIVTPEQTFNSCNIERYDYKRTARDGVGVIVVNLYFKEIRVNNTSEFTNTPSTAPTVEQAQGATTSATADNARAAGALPAAQVQNPASASEVSQGQTNALPATPNQAAPSPGAGRGSQGVPVTAAGALTALPTGYTQDPATNLIRGPNGKVDTSLTVTQGTSYIGPGG